MPEMKEIGGVQAVVLLLLVAVVAAAAVVSVRPALPCCSHPEPWENLESR